jgi:hypothetical protein
MPLKNKNLKTSTETDCAMQKKILKKRAAGQKKAQPILIPIIHGANKKKREFKANFNFIAPLKLTLVVQDKQTGTPNYRL